MVVGWLKEAFLKLQGGFVFVEFCRQVISAGVLYVFLRICLSACCKLFLLFWIAFLGSRRRFGSPLGSEAGAMGPLLSLWFARSLRKRVVVGWLDGVIREFETSM